MTNEQPNEPREILTHDRRLRILQALEWSNGYMSNSMLLKELLNLVGHATSSHVVEADLLWLEDVGVVALRRREGFIVATLTTRGLDVVNDACRLTGIARPAPDGTIFKP